MAKSKHADERPPRSTAEERRDLLDNFRIVALHYKLPCDTIAIAWESALGCPGKASRIYAAIVRSL